MGSISLSKGINTEKKRYYSCNSLKSRNLLGVVPTFSECFLSLFLSLSLWVIFILLDGVCYLSEEFPLFCKVNVSFLPLEREN